MPWTTRKRCRNSREQFVFILPAAGYKVVTVGRGRAGCCIVEFGLRNDCFQVLYGILWLSQATPAAVQHAWMTSTGPALPGSTRTAPWPGRIGVAGLQRLCQFRPGNNPIHLLQKLFLFLEYCSISPETGQIFLQLLSANKAACPDVG